MCPQESPTSAGGVATASASATTRRNEKKDDKAASPATSPPQAEVSTSSAFVLDAAQSATAAADATDGREELIGRIAQFANESNPGQEASSSPTVATSTTRPTTTFPVLEEAASPLPADLGLSSTFTNNGPTKRAPANQRRRRPTSSASSARRDPLRPRRSERHHFAIAIDILDCLFDDDDEGMDEEDDDNDDDVVDDADAISVDSESPSQNAHAA